MRQLVFEPYISIGLWGTLAGLGAVLWLAYALTSRRRLPRNRWLAIIALMASTLAVPLALLLNPTWVEPIPKPAGKPLLTVLLDRSASMATPDAPGGKTRYQAASAMAERLEEDLRSRYEIRVRTFADRSTLAKPSGLKRARADGAATDLAAAIEDGLEEDRPQGQAMVLLSDGIHNVGGIDRVRASADRARAMAAPLLVKTFGGEANIDDVAVELNLPEELAFVGQRLAVVASIRQRGALARQGTLALVKDGVPVETRSVELLPDGQGEEIFFVHEEKTGLFRYEVRLEPVPGEVTGVNNAATLLVRVIDEPIRVLLLEGRPYWDSKFLVRTLAQDESIELTSVVRLTDSRLLQRVFHAAGGKEASAASHPADTGPAAAPGPAGGVAGEPGSRQDAWQIRSDVSDLLAGLDSLDAAQILVLGRDAEAFLNDAALQRLERWLQEKGGSLVCYRGAPSSQINERLGRLMPVAWAAGPESRFRMKWTDLGQALRWLPASDAESLPQLPSLAAGAKPERTRPLAVVLAIASPGDAMPTMVYQRVGSGRVVAVEGSGMWRWAFLPPEHQAHDAAYGALWRSLIRWLISNVGLLPSQSMALRANKVTFSTDETVTAELLLRQETWKGDVPQVELTGDALSEPKRFAPMPAGDFPGQYRIALGQLPEGRYAARVLGAPEEELSARTQFDVRGNLQERLEVTARPDLMQYLAERTGGGVCEEGDPATVAGYFDRHLARTHPERMLRTLAWDRPWVLAVAVGLCAAAWGVRRWSGLV